MAGRVGAKYHWKAKVLALGCAVLFAGLFGSVLSPELTLLGFVALLFGIDSVINGRSRMESRFSLALLTGAVFLICAATAFGISVSDPGPAFGVLVVVAALIHATDRLLRFVPYFRDRSSSDR